MEELKTKAEAFTKSVSDYLDTYYKLTLVKVTQKSTNLVSAILAGVASLILLFLVLFFIGIGVSWWLGDLLNSRPAGFFIVGGIFILLIVVIFSLRKKIVFPILKKAILKKLYE